MIDQELRKQYREKQANSGMLEATKNAIKEGFAQKGPEDTLKMVFERKDDQQVVSLLEKIGNALPIMLRAFPKGIVLPKIFQVKGTVAITNPITINNLSGLERKLEDLATQFRSLTLAISSIPQQKIEFPKLEMPKSEKIDFSPIVEAVQELETALGKRTDGDTVPAIRDLKKVMQAIADKPTFTPNPVTNVNINALKGLVKTSAVTVGTTLTKLPAYGQLFARRAVVIYNNSANTIYVGGSDVTVSNGIPVPAASYSNIFDAGYNMIVYGIAATSNNDIRVMEVSSDTSGNVQE